MINRVNCKKWLSDIYAPGGKPGVYHVLSEVVGCFVGMPCVVGHVVLLNGKPTRVWMVP